MKIEKYALLDTDFISKTHFIHGDTEKCLVDLVVEMLPFEDDNGGKLSYTLNGTLYPDERVVIYDIGDVKPETEKKRRGRRKKSEIEAEQKEN